MKKNKQQFRFRRVLPSASEHPNHQKQQSQLQSKDDFTLNSQLIRQFDQKFTSQQINPQSNIHHFSSNTSKNIEKFINKPKEQYSDFFNGPFQKEISIEWPLELQSLIPQAQTSLNCDPRSQPIQKSNSIKDAIQQKDIALDRDKLEDINQPNENEMYFAKLFTNNSEFESGPILGRKIRRNYDEVQNKKYFSLIQKVKAFILCQEIDAVFKCVQQLMDQRQKQAKAFKLGSLETCQSHLESQNQTLSLVAHTVLQDLKNYGSKNWREICKDENQNPNMSVKLFITGNSTSTFVFLIQSILVAITKRIQLAMHSGTRSARAKLSGQIWNDLNLIICNHLKDQNAIQSLHEQAFKVNLQFKVAIEPQGQQAKTTPKTYWSPTINFTDLFCNSNLIEDFQWINHHDLLTLIQNTQVYSFIQQLFMNPVHPQLFDLFDGHLKKVFISKIKIQFFNVPSIKNLDKTTHGILPLPQINTYTNDEQYDNQNNMKMEISYKSQMPLYAISRARIQYLGGSIPLFRFQHCLFEALICCIHEQDIKPKTFFIDEPEVLQEPIDQEKFLMRKFLEFLHNTQLLPLLQLSLLGDAVSFVKYFNGLTNHQCPYYSKFKLHLYCINQRKFAIQPIKNSSQSNNRDRYLVHYNGFVFAANISKMLIIREREEGSAQQSLDGAREDDEESVVEIKQIQADCQQNDEALQNYEMALQNDQQDGQYMQIFMQVDDEEEAEGEQDEQYRDQITQVDQAAQVIQLSSEDEKLDNTMDAGFINNLEKEELDQDNEDGNSSDIDIHNGFSLSSRYSSRFQKMRAMRLLKRKQQRYRENFQDVENEQYEQLFEDDLNHGCIAIKMEFKYTRLEVANSFRHCPHRLVAYGTLPNQKYAEIRQFDGSNCHVSFLVWILQNLEDYKIDCRSDQTQLSIFTLNGSHKELSWLLRGLVKVTGRDTYFFGDFNKIKSLQHGNIRFLDLQNFFINHNINSLQNSWLSSQDLEIIHTKSNDPKVIQAHIIYYLSKKFLSTLKQINFYPYLDKIGRIDYQRARQFDFDNFQSATSSSLALHIFQYVYLDQSTEIRGTWHKKILNKEISSLHSPNFYINRTNQMLGCKSNQSPQNTYAVYRLNLMHAKIFLESPIPYQFKQFRALNFHYDSHKQICQYRYIQQQRLSMKLSPRNLQLGSQQQHAQLTSDFTIYYSSLYRVNRLVFNKNNALANLLFSQLKQNIVRRQAQNDELRNSSDGSLNVLEENEIRDEYIWGVELIFALKTGQAGTALPVLQLEISEEITYFQSQQIFKVFIKDLMSKLYNDNQPLEPCLKDIYEMILDTFHTKFSQKHFPLQQIIHINDLQLMLPKSGKQSSAAPSESQFYRFEEIDYPFYYVESIPKSKVATGHMQQVGSLTRITAYINACTRVHVAQSVLAQSGSLESIKYLDRSNLILENSLLLEESLTASSVVLQQAQLGPWQQPDPLCRSYRMQDLGKWRLQYEVLNEESYQYLSTFIQHLNDHPQALVLGHKENFLRSLSHHEHFQQFCKLIQSRGPRANATTNYKQLFTTFTLFNYLHTCSTKSQLLQVGCKLFDIDQQNKQNLSLLQHSLAQFPALQKKQYMMSEYKEPKQQESDDNQFSKTLFSPSALLFFMPRLSKVISSGIKLFEETTWPYLNCQQTYQQAYLKEQTMKARFLEDSSWLKSNHLTNKVQSENQTSQHKNESMTFNQKDLAQSNLQQNVMRPLNGNEGDKNLKKRAARDQVPHEQDGHLVIEDDDYDHVQKIQRVKE